MLSDNLVEKILKVVKSGCDMLPTLTVSFIGGLNLPLSGICSSLTETLIKVRPDKTVQVTNQTEYDCFSRLCCYVTHLARLSVTLTGIRVSHSVNLRGGFKLGSSTEDHSNLDPSIT